MVHGHDSAACFHKIIAFISLFKSGAMHIVQCAVQLFRILHILTIWPLPLWHGDRLIIINIITITDIIIIIGLFKFLLVMMDSASLAISLLLNGLTLTATLTPLICNTHVRVMLMMMMVMMVMMLMILVMLVMMKQSTRLCVQPLPSYCVLLLISWHCW